MLEVKSVKKKRAVVVFELGEGEAQHEVSVLGDFNGWDPFATPMKRRSNGSLRAKVKVPRGYVYEFKYLSDDGTWFCDPDVETRVGPDGVSNSVLRVD